MNIKAKYNGYLYSYDPEKKEISTVRKHKTNKSFVKDGSVWRKKVTEEDLSDIFEDWLLVEYDTSIPDIPTWWRVRNLTEDGTFMVKYTEGLLPGWDVIGDNTCIKKFLITDFECGVAFFMFTKADGEMFEEPLPSKIDVPLSSMLTLFNDMESDL